MCDTSCGDTGVFAHIAENAIFHLSAPQEGREEVTKAFASTADKGTCQKRFSGFCPLRGVGGTPPFR